ncbi:MAG: NAD(+) diphosphatase [Sphingopyxis sp.]
MTAQQPGFTGARIDRADAIRTNPERLAQAMGSLSARLLLLDGIDPVADEQGQLAWGTLADAPMDADLLFLGLVDGKPCFAALPPPGARVDARSRSCWRVLAHMAADQVALYGAARSLIDWHARHRFCAGCGGPTVPAKGGWQRNCTGCGAEHFPRTDPVVIMLAEHDGHALIGRQHGWPAGNYSALAGFVEPGESIEEAVAREIAEEAGVTVSAVRYVASQPWPFPSSLMIACIGVAAARDIVLDTTELEDAFWASRADVAAALRGDAGARFTAPPPFAIAHTLLTRWVDGA